jgi:hypothetical protein
MRKVIILFTSPRESTNEYESIWRKSPCEGQENNQRGYRMLKRTDWEIHVFNGLNNEYYKDGWKFNILKQKINEHTKDCSEDWEVAVFLHGSSKEEFNQLKDSLGSDFSWPVISYSKFTGSLYNNCICPFASRCGDDEFQKLWNEVELEKKEARCRRAEQFRHEVLSPLVAVDLLKQAGQEVSDNIKTALQAVIQQGTVSKLCKELENNNFKTDIIQLINNYSSFNRDNFHQKLVAIAEILEREILKLET